MIFLRQTIFLFLFLYSTLSYSSSVTKQIKKAQELSWENKYIESIQEYKKVLRVYPNRLKALDGLAEVLSWNKQYEESVSP